MSCKNKTTTKKPHSEYSLTRPLYNISTLLNMRRKPQNQSKHATQEHSRLPSVRNKGSAERDCDKPVHSYREREASRVCHPEDKRGLHCKISAAKSHYTENCLLGIGHWLVSVFNTRKSYINISSRESEG